MIWIEYSAKDSVSRRRKLVWLALPALILLMAGCAATGPRHTTIALENPSNAVVIVYRPSPPKNMFFTNSYHYVSAPDIYHEERELTELKVNAYTYIEIVPGVTTFSARDKVFGIPVPQLEIEIDAKAGQYYYLRYETQFSEETPAVLKFMPVELARQEIRKTRYSRASE